MKLDFRKIKTYSLKGRHSKVRRKDFAVAAKKGASFKGSYHIGNEIGETYFIVIKQDFENWLDKESE